MTKSIEKQVKKANKAKKAAAKPDKPAKASKPKSAKAAKGNGHATVVPDPGLLTQAEDAALAAEAGEVSAN